MELKRDREKFGTDVQITQIHSNVPFLNLGDLDVCPRIFLKLPAGWALLRVRRAKLAWQRQALELLQSF